MVSKYIAIHIAAFMCKDKLTNTSENVYDWKTN